MGSRESVCAPPPRPLTLPVSAPRVWLGRRGLDGLDGYGRFRAARWLGPKAVAKRKMIAINAGLVFGSELTFEFELELGLGFEYLL